MPKFGVAIRWAPKRSSYHATEVARSGAWTLTWLTRMALIAGASLSSARRGPAFRRRACTPGARRRLVDGALPMKGGAGRRLRHRPSEAGRPHKPGLNVSCAKRPGPCHPGDALSDVGPAGAAGQRRAAPGARKKVHEFAAMNGEHALPGHRPLSPSCP